MAKAFPYQMSKFVQICRWMLIAISNFAIVEEMDPAPADWKS